MPTRIATLLLCSLIANQAAAKDSMAVMPLKSSKLDKGTVATLDELLVQIVGDAAPYDVISIDDINAMLGHERLKEALGCDDVSCAAEIGGSIGARFILSGSVRKLGSKLHVLLNLIDTGSQKIHSRGRAKVRDHEDQYELALETAVAKLFGKKPPAQTGGGSAQPPVSPPPAPAAAPTWENIDGLLKQTSVGKEWLWGVNSADAIFRRPVDGSGAWQQIAGSLKHVSASGRGWIWGVNLNDDIYRCQKPCATARWIHVPGKLKQISGGDQYVWGVNSNDDIYRRPVDGSGNWQRIPGKLKHVSASGGGFIWGVNANDDIYRCVKPCADARWAHIPGKLKQIDGGDTHVWGVNSANRIYRRPVDGSGDWAQIDGRLKYVACAGSVWIWGVNGANMIYRRRQR